MEGIIVWGAWTAIGRVNAGAAAGGVVGVGVGIRTGAGLAGTGVSTIGIGTGCKAGAVTGVICAAVVTAGGATGGGAISATVGWICVIATVGGVSTIATGGLATIWDAVTWTEVGVIEGGVGTGRGFFCGTDGCVGKVACGASATGARETCV